jgi:hypothetical protein
MMLSSSQGWGALLAMLPAAYGGQVTRITVGDAGMGHEADAQATLPASRLARPSALAGRVLTLGQSATAG